ncbi:DNA mismatch endonuclease (patch repair protein) [Nitrobacter vulgaris]|uniref:very short patch repair endonuclease n=1 Tax=Nitrobacter vulgaris TaxID=29421 RepID=UPI00285472D5|nr:very short patch repair endonuclease [Nitrobacter vulgaris]MDR6302507.1 DNA mismatch endonuclease (patch repair protein) [Nitrobacter vulgaris]
MNVFSSLFCSCGIQFVPPVLSRLLSLPRSVPDKASHIRRPRKRPRRAPYGRPMAVHRRAAGRARAKRADRGTGKQPKSKESYACHRSWTMAQVKSKNTTLEMVVRKAAHAFGLRFRLHCADLPGKPDLVFPRWRTAVFVNGCFWHSHRNCERARIPRTNVDYWTKKLRRNMRRDQESVKLLKKSGWRCAVIWECQAKDTAKLDRILRRLFASMPLR